MTETSSPARLRDLTAQIVAAHISHNPVTPEVLLGLISIVHEALAGTGRTLVEAAKPQPAVPLKRSVFPDHIVCLEDGKKLKMLKRHLMTTYHLTPDQDPAEMGSSGQLSDGGAGLCGAAVGIGEKHWPWAQARGDADTGCSPSTRKAPWPAATESGGIVGRQSAEAPAIRRPSSCCTSSR